MGVKHSEIEAVTAMELRMQKLEFCAHLLNRLHRAKLDNDIRAILADLARVTKSMKRQRKEQRAKR